MKLKQQIPAILLAAALLSASVPAAGISLEQPEQAGEMSVGTAVSELHGGSAVSSCALELQGQAFELPVYNPGDIAVPYIAAFKADGIGAACSWTDVGAEAADYITVSGGKAVLTAYPSDTVVSTLTMTISDGENTSEVVYPISVYKKMSEFPGLLDGGFETSALSAVSTSARTAGWGVNEGYDWNITAEIVDTASGSSSKSLHINSYAASLSSEGILSNVFPVSAGTTYTVEYSVMIPESSPMASGDYIYPYLELYDTDYNYTHRINGSQFIKGTTDGFVECSFTATPSDGDVYGSVAFYAWAGTTYEAYVDDVDIYWKAEGCDAFYTALAKDAADKLADAKTALTKDGTTASLDTVGAKLTLNEEAFTDGVRARVASVTGDGAMYFDTDDYSVSLNAKPSAADGDKTAVVTVELSYGENTDTVTYEITAKASAVETEADRIAAVLEDGVYTIHVMNPGDIAIPGEAAYTAWKNGAECTWKSVGTEAVGYITVSGGKASLTAYPASTVTSTLILAVTVGTDTATVEYPISISKKMIEYPGILDGGFETSVLAARAASARTSGWGVNEGYDWNITAEIVDTASGSGNKSLHINSYAASLSSEGILSNVFPVSAGTTYTVEYSVMIPESSPMASGDYIYPYLELYDADYNYTHRVNGSQFIKGTTDGFVRCSFTATPSGGDVYGSVAFYAWAGTTYEVYVDDVDIYWKDAGYDAYIESVNAAAATKLTAAKAILTDDGLTFTLENVGDTYELPADVFAGGVKAIVKSVEGEGAACLGNDTFAVKLLSKPSSAEGDKTASAVIGLEYDGVTEDVTCTLTLKAAEAPSAADALAAGIGTAPIFVYLPGAIEIPSGAMILAGKAGAACAWNVVGTDAAAYITVTDGVASLTAYPEDTVTSTLTLAVTLDGNTASVEYPISISKKMVEYPGLLDGGFETSKLTVSTPDARTSGWGVNEGNEWNITAEIVDTASGSGSKSLHINSYAASLNAEGILSNVFPVNAGTTYTVEYSVMIPESSPMASGDYIYPYLELYDSGCNYTHRINGSQFIKGSTEGFVRCSFTATPSDGDVYGSVAFYAWSGTTYEAYVDDVSISWKAAGADEFLTGVQTAAEEKIEAAKSALTADGTAITLEEIGDMLTIDAAALADGVNAKIVSVTGDGAALLDVSPYSVKMTSKPKAGEPDKTAAVTVELSKDGFAEQFAYTVTVKSEDAAAPLVFNLTSVRTTGNAGIRFAAYVDEARRTMSDEYGFIVALGNDTFGDHPEYLCFNAAKDEKGVNTYGVKYVSGVNYDKATGTDLLYANNGQFIGQPELEGYFFTAVMYGVPLAKADTLIAVRPYLRAGDDIYYGGIATSSLLEAANAVKDAGYPGLDQAGIDYIDSIIG